MAPRRLRFTLLSAALAVVAVTVNHAADAADVDPAAARIEHIERLLREVHVQLDSLKGEASAPAANGPIAGELLSDRQRILARATHTEFKTVAAGYSFDLDLPVGMHALYWRDPWGLKVSGGFIVTDNTRLAGFNVSPLYSIHRFQALDLLETHLYALAGAGLYWQRRQDNVNISRTWYTTTDLRARWQLGVGTELSFFNLGGVRVAPEVGLQADQYFSRYQESASWASNWPGREPPRSDFSLDPFLSFHASFYFR